MSVEPNCAAAAAFIGRSAAAASPIVASWLPWQRKDTGNEMMLLPEVIEYLDDVPSEFAGSAFAALREPAVRAQRAPLIEILQPSAALSRPVDDLLPLEHLRRRTH
ncbi:hypothetical protein M8A51_08155 [Schlegelella sp. S2-27]|uniref:Uncharacterized protein n=1 Tax=Caldimonas mangrovi TaxID=2944811 RepID=A0ABT0YMM4_9BURK|nr:hypothetical protein [Caldimonas mangrovi]MCM5679502.1 hypothetical protein [Caldimonas mangrovi]